MKGSPYRKFSISWKGARFQGPNSGFLLAGTWSIPLSGTRGSGSCLEAGGNDTGVFFSKNSHLEKLALSLIAAARKLRPYFQAHPIVVGTSFLVKLVLHKPEVSGRLAKWAGELWYYDVIF